MLIHKIFLTGVVLLAVVGCAPKGGDSTMPFALSSNSKSDAFVQKVIEASKKVPVNTDVLSLESALAKTLKRNLSLKAILWEISSKDGAIIQSKRWQNPELSLDVEHLLGKDGFDAVESQVQISQTIELGGKIKRRTNVAKAEKRVAIQEALLLRADILNETSLLFMDVVEAQFKLEQQVSNAEIAKTIYNVVKERVKAGKVSPLEEKRALVVYMQSKLRLNEAKSAFRSSKILLSKMWVDKKPNFKKVNFKLGKASSPPSLLSLEKQISDSPAFLLGQLKFKLEEEKVSLEKSNAIPDLTVNAAYQKYEENSDSAVAIGFSLPLTIFNKNRGNIKEADALKMKAGAKFKSIVNLLSADLSEVFIELQTSYKKLSSLKNEIQPSAKSVFADAQTGYQKGRFDFLTVLDAQRSLFEVNIDIIRTEVELKKNIIKANRLVGKVEIIK